MNVHHGQCCGLLMALLAGGTAWGSSNIVSDVRYALDGVTAAMPDDRRKTADYLYEFGYKYRSNPHYMTLATIVSNDLQAVNAVFSVCATNELDRLILLSTAWAFGDDYYLNCISNDLELVHAGVLSRREFLWVRKGSRSTHLLGLIPMEYNRPGISNLVARMQQVIGETNYCQRILSGEARTDVINYIESMSGASNE